MYRTPRIPTVDCTLRLDARSETASLRFQSQPSSDLFASGKNCRETRFQPLGHRHSAGLSPRARAKVEAADKGWKLVWHDEFDGPTLNPEYWSFDTGPWKQSGELECYTNRPENVRIEDGKLVIEARKEARGPPVYVGSDTHEGQGRKEVRPNRSADQDAGGPGYLACLLDARHQLQRR